MSFSPEVQLPVAGFPLARGTVLFPLCNSKMSAGSYLSSHVLCQSCLPATVEGFKLSRTRVGAAIDKVSQKLSSGVTWQSEVTDGFISSGCRGLIQFFIQPETFYK